MITEGALTVLKQRYFRRDENGREIEDIEGMFERVAAAIAAPADLFGEKRDYWRERFLERLRRLEFLPNSPTLMNAGAEGAQLAACFVLPVDDDLDSIFATIRLTARIHQTGGGTGFSFSSLRPRGDIVRSTGGMSSGPLSFIELIDHTTSVIRAGGRRRGANMAVLSVNHPDILEFVEAKRTPGQFENFNLSVAVTDEFLAACEAYRAIALRNPRTGAVTRTLSASELMEAIVEAAWAVGDPGLVFIDEINRHNPTPLLGRIEATNPCGEQPLLAHESCTLGSINLGVLAQAGAAIDWKRMGEIVRDAVVFLDNVVEANRYPSPEIAAATRRTRKIGLGVMGLADVLARIGIPYDSDEAIKLGGQIAAFLTETARNASVELARRRGSFPAFAQSIWPERGFAAMRNATTTCIAPTGTISLIAGASSGIEPFFALATARRILGERRIIEIDGALETELRSLGETGKKALDAVARHGSLAAVVGVPAHLKRRFPIALEIQPEYHVRMQAAFQDHIDAAVSKTINLPTDAPVSTVREAFRLARNLKLKGLTVYRYGSRPDQTLSLVEDADALTCRECAV